MKNYLISEWKQIIIQEEILPSDYPLLRQLNEQERIEVDELKQGIRFKAKSWVGIIKFSNFQVQIVPKLAGGNLGLVDMLAVTTGIQALKKYKSQRYLEPEKKYNLFDLIALLYYDACEAILSGGLRYDYERIEDALPMLRGRFLFDKQYQNRFGLLDRLECRFDEHSSNILDNKLLAYGLLKATRIVQNEVIKAKIRQLFTIFTDSCQISDLDIDGARNEMIYNRLNAHYRDAHHLAWIIIDGLGIEDIYKSKYTPSFAFLLDMNALFEKFIFVFLNHINAERNLIISYQRREKSIIWDLFNQRTYSTIIPDYLITGNETNRKIAVDAKYKLYDDRKMDSADIAQIFLYAYAYNHSSRPIAYLLFPTEKTTEVTASMIIRKYSQDDGARIKLIGLSIQSAIDEIQSNKIMGTGYFVANEIMSQLT